MDLGLQDKVYVLTGASRGLGLAAARELVTDGARVVLTGRQQDRLDAAVAALGGPDHALGLVADNADPAGAERVLSTATAHFGRLDGVLISVGGPATGPVLKAADEDWRAAFESVFLGAVRFARTAAGLLAEGGVIAFVLSSSVREPIPGLGISNGLRPGLAMAAKSLANELGPRGIRVLGLLPSRIDTDRVRELDSLSPDPVAARAAASAAIPLGRYGAPEEFGRVAAFALSPAASYLTGLMIPVDGGALHAL
ncbi:SDR family oxidoreductase [Kitasatospora viridis]|uniref:3-oxoacyl-[acyl-carrier protein] reductase n=1 Tax=Kitasatospora viridis TaxID=281105 RepID=A0A561UD09_9ACTN|nr:SDR family oxidoreductase [Kitasatospora viridis]TWF97263.1 3-oxoacyl-[acyl-carrier protein] reductase [Kitasatospora viridis]